MNFAIDVLALRTMHPFIIARGGGSEFRNVRLRIDWEGIVAEGEGSPTHYYGETLEITLAALARFAEALPDRDLAGLDRRGIEEILGEADRILAGHPAAKAALDGALWDLCGKQRGEPVWRVLGLETPVPLETSFTVALAEPEVMLARATEAVGEGFTILKLKAGSSDDIDVALRIAAATGARIRVDANGAWRASEALAKMERLALAGVEFVEQPLEWDDLAGYREIAGRCPLPVVLDESVRDELSLEVFGEYADGVNLKISKCGGIARCAALAERARGAGLDLMMGCMIESSLGIAQGAQLLPLLRWADLDGFLLIESDPYRGLRHGEGGLLPADGPGLGVERSAE